MTLLRLRTPEVVRLLFGEVGLEAVVFEPVVLEAVVLVAVALSGVVVFFFVTGGVAFSGTDVFLSGTVPALSCCGAG